MKREHIISSDTSNVPFAEDLVFYAPLTEGDLTDHISVTLPTSSPSGTNGSGISWDSTNSMYAFEAVSVWGYAALWDQLNMGLSDGDPITICIDVVEDVDTFNSSTTNRFNSMIGTPKWTSSKAMVYICHYRYDTTYNALTGLHRYVATWENGNIKWYKDGVLSNTGSGWNANSDFSNNEVTICLVPTNNSYYKIWAKNARIYNRAMSASEVAQL